jgi:hypothetical protein
MYQARHLERRLRERVADFKVVLLTGLQNFSMMQHVTESLAGRKSI